MQQSSVPHRSRLHLSIPDRDLASWSGLHEATLSSVVDVKQGLTLLRVELPAAHEEVEILLDLGRTTELALQLVGAVKRLRGAGWRLG